MEPDTTSPDTRAPAPTAPTEPVTIHRSVEVDGDDTVAWSLVGDPEGLGQWLADEVDVELAAGARGRIRDDDEVREVRIDRVEEGREVAFTWWPEGDGEGRASHVVITVAPTAGGSRIEVSEVLPASSLGAQASALAASTARWGLAALLLWAAARAHRVAAGVR